MHSSTHLATALLVLASAGSGYAVHGLLHHASAAGDRETIPPAEYFHHARSFSELENARAELDARALRLVFEVRARRVEALGFTPARSVSPASNRNADVAQLEQAVVELRGTGWEPVVIRDLLGTLKQNGDTRRWLDLYLDTILRQPTTELAAVYAREACRLGRITGRRAEVAAALRLVRANPLSSIDEEILAKALVELGPEPDPEPDFPPAPPADLRSASHT